MDTQSNTDFSGFAHATDDQPTTSPTSPPVFIEPQKDEVEEFARAMDAYKRRSGRMFPTWSEVLEVLRSLGYSRGPSPKPRAPAPLKGRRLMIVREGSRARDVSRLLARFGSAPAARGVPHLLEFPSTEARDHAMDVARRSFGWTCVEPRP